MRAATFLRVVLPLAAVPLLVSATGVGVSSAAQDAELRCRLTKEDIIQPGLTLDGSSGGFYTPAPGNMTCEGTIGGRKADPKALGRFLEKGEYGTKDPDNCLAGEGKGIFGAIIPTEHGSARISAPFTFTYGDIPPLRGGIVGGTFRGDGFTGTIDIFPLEGDCLFTPITKIYTLDEIVFSSSSSADWTFVEE